MITARSTPNIALIKYWGNRNDDLRLCAAGSTSMTLDGPYVDVSVECADTFSVSSHNKKLGEKDIARFSKTYELIKTYLTAQSSQLRAQSSLSISIDSHIPPSIGLASSAAVFSALAKAIAGLLDTGLTDEQISVMARLGSGSAARSIFGGFAALTNHESRIANNELIDTSTAYQIATSEHWPLHDIIIVPSMDEKKVGSTEGHAAAWSSPHFRDRLSAIEHHRLQDCIDAIREKDFEKLQQVAEEDCLDMHRCMSTQTPPLNYLNAETHRITGEIEEIRKSEHLPVLYTMDAGPTVHLFCEESARMRVLEYAKAQKGCAIFEARAGKGSRILG
ncbi:diphosphomevalonate decarboxylase [Candidatus Peregrinibacteria bacterium]|nr:diphosphomevalonate decarboxylase [Candidatus Peregrinibacteria bacterium]